MKKKQLQLILTQWLAGVLLVLICLPAPVAAQRETNSAETASWVLTKLTGTAPLSLRGYRPAVVLDLLLSPAWQAADDGELTLDYRLSELVLEGAVLTIRFNNQTLHSVPFESTVGTLRFRLPAELWHSGQNSLELAALLPLVEDDRCVIPDHPARWLEFDPTSRVDLPVAPNQQPLNLADFSTLFEAAGETIPAPVTFVPPDHPTADELNALAALAFAVARENSNQSPWLVTPMAAFDPNQLTGPAILVGAEGHHRLVDELRPAGDSQSGWLSLTRPEWAGGQPVLAAGGPDGPALVQAASALLDPVATLRLQGGQAVVETLPPLDLTPLAEQVTLADLGYPERTVRGSGEHSLIYSFDLPFAWTPENSRLQLNFVHAALLDPRAATLDVFLNGRSVAGIILDAPEQAINLVDLTLPGHLLRPGRNFLRLSFNFGSPIELCDWDTAAELWASVRPETMLTLSHRNEGGRLNLEDYPYLFATEIDLNDMVIALPTDPAANDLADALNLVRAVAGQSRSRVAPRLVYADASSEASKQGHLVLVGSPARQPLLAEVNRYLPLPFDLEQGTLPPAYDIRLPTAASNLGVLQILRSPWAERRILLVASGVTVSGNAQAMRLLTVPDLQSQLAGQVVLTAAPDDKLSPPAIYTRYIGDIYAVPGAGEVDRFFDRLFGAGSPWPAILMVAAGLALLALIAFLGLRWLRHHQAARLG